MPAGGAPNLFVSPLVLFAVQRCSGLPTSSDLHLWFPPSKGMVSGFRPLSRAVRRVRDSIVAGYPVSVTKRAAQHGGPHAPRPRTLGGLQRRVGGTPKRDGWTFGIQSALEEPFALPPFPVEATPLSRRPFVAGAGQRLRGRSKEQLRARDRNSGCITTKKAARNAARTGVTPQRNRPERSGQVLSPGPRRHNFEGDRQHQVTEGG